MVVASEVPTVGALPTVAALEVSTAAALEVSMVEVSTVAAVTLEVAGVNKHHPA